MSVFQNSHMAGRTGFGSGGGYRQPRGGMTRQDAFGNGVRQAIQQPSNMQMAPARQAFSAYSPSQNSQSMAPARQAFAAYAPQQPTAQPQAAPQFTPQPRITQTTTVNNAPPQQRQPVVPQGQPRPVNYAMQPPPGSGNWMNDPNQRAAVGLGSGTIRPGELIM
jgi:hypothetical protein